MNPQQEEHIDSINRRFVKANKYKYSLGCQEHKGHLWEVDSLQLIRFALEEVQDLTNYLYSALDSLEAEREALKTEDLA